jgi:hypothetical protein
MRQGGVGNVYNNNNNNNNRERKKNTLNISSRLSIAAAAGVHANWFCFSDCVKE